MHTLPEQGIVQRFEKTNPSHPMQAILKAIPPYALFLLGLASVLTLGLVKLYGMLQAAGLGQ